MAKYRVISSDSHIIEPPDLWEKRIDPKFRDRAPQVVDVDGGQIWVVDDTQGGSFTQGVMTGWRFDQPEKMVNIMASFEDVRPGGYIPDEAVKDLDLDEVDACILYPTAGLTWYSWVRDSELLSAVLRAYNDFAAEFAAAHPKRLKTVAFLNVDDVWDGVREMERCAKLGVVGVAIPIYTERLRYHSPEYEPLWAAAQDLEMPISLHITTNRPGPDKEYGGAQLNTTLAPHFIVTGDYWAKVSLCDIIYSGVFERYPKLRMGSVEQELSWAAYFLNRLDFNYNQQPQGWRAYRLKDDALPSDFFHRNCFVDTQEDALGIKLRDIIGVDNILWGNDYPHSESTFPKSQEFLAGMLADCTEEEKAKISGGNAARIYKI